jgi:hypothetical protein
VSEMGGADKTSTLKKIFYGALYQEQKQFTA